MTADEAKTKWCPFARATLEGGWLSTSAFNRAGAVHGPNNAQLTLNPQMCRCIASDCMAWRWADQSRETAQTEAARGEPPAPEGEGWAPRDSRFHDGTGSRTWYRNWWRPNPNRRGFCGLAGSPQELRRAGL